MLTGLDTGFFFALQEQNSVAFRVWQERETITSVVVLYELQIVQFEFRNPKTVSGKSRVAGYVRCFDFLTKKKRPISTTPATPLHSMRTSAGFFVSSTLPEGQNCRELD